MCMYMQSSIHASLHTCYFLACMAHILAKLGLIREINVFMKSAKLESQEYFRHVWIFSMHWEGARGLNNSPKASQRGQMTPNSHLQKLERRLTGWPKISRSRQNLVSQIYPQYCQNMVLT